MGARRAELRTAGSPAAPFHRWGKARRGAQPPAAGARGSRVGAASPWSGGPTFRPVAFCFLPEGRC